jgi:putative radical SAM enzyme (TIGR03279 family)
MAAADSGATAGGLISAVDPDGIAAEVGIEPGDRLLSINGHPLRDIIDYRYYGAEEELILAIQRDDEVHTVEIERDYDEALGITFAESLFDGIRTCANQCPFCFVAQMPRGMRRSLYLRDDDYRYSFLQAGFVTLTNLSEEDWERIGEQRLSPLYVSVHATDLAVRRELLGNPDAPGVVEQLMRLADMGIIVHAQAVIVPGLNDGAVLAETIERLLSLWPTVQSLALVPVGLTRFCRRPLATLTASDAEAVLALASRYRASAQAKTGTTWLYPSDEMFLLAEREVPPARFYQEDAQRENGVGLVRGLLDDWARARSRLRRVSAGGLKITLVCGTLIAPVLASLVHEAKEVTDAEMVLVPIENRWFGASVTVSGLLTGEDLLAALADRDLGDLVCIPRAMLDEAGERTLDDMTLAGLEAGLHRPVQPVSTMSEVLDALERVRGSHGGGVKRD